MMAILGASIDQLASGQRSDHRLVGDQTSG